MSYSEFLNYIGNAIPLFISTLTKWSTLLIKNYFFLTILGVTLFSSFLLWLISYIKSLNISNNLDFYNSDTFSGVKSLKLGESGGYISTPVSSSDNNVVSDNIITAYTPLMDVPPPEPEPRVYTSKFDALTGKTTLVTDENLGLISPIDPPEPVYTPQMEISPPPGKDDPYEYREFDEYYYDSDYYEYRDNIDMLEGDFGSYD